MKYQIRFYDLPKSQKVPIEDFLEELRRDNPKLHIKTFRNLELLSDYGSDLGAPFIKYLSDGIYELRSVFGSNAARIFYFFFSKEENVIVLTNGFLKKTQKTPIHELEKAKQYKSEYESRQS